MKGKLLQKSIALILVLCMTMVNFIFVAANTVYALSEKEASIEGGNIIFDAYFKTQSGHKIYEKTGNIAEGEKLFIDISLKAGVFENEKAIIKINNANFKLPKTIESQYVEGISHQTNEIYLRGLNSSYVNKIELEIPIEFEKQSTMSVDYFNMENEITLSGKYKASETYKSVSATINTKLKWQGEASVQNTDGFEKAVFEENRVILQEAITSTSSNLPKVSERIKVVAPKVLDNFPSKIVVLQNGEKVSESKILDNYNVNTGTLELKFDFIENNTINWKNDTDTYKFIYIYEQTVEKAQMKTAVTKGTAQLFIKVFGFENDEFKSKVYSSGSGYNYGHIVTVNAESLSKDVYKGYMYSNSENGTTYNEKYDIEISDVNALNKVELNLEKDNFLPGDISTNNKTAYKKLVLNWKNVSKILGENGTLTIKDDQTTTEINNGTKRDENSNITVPVNSHNITITTSAPKSEGNLHIYAQKQIVGNAGLSKEQVAAINGISTTMKVTTNKDEDGVTATTATELKEPSTSASLTMLNNNINTNNVLLTNEANKVDFQATLRTGTEDSYLFKKPTIKIQLPQDVTEVNNLTAKALFAENELNVNKAEVRDENNAKVIYIEVDGESKSFDNKVTEGIKVTVNADITLNKYATSKADQITMVYTNENASSNPEPITLGINIQSPSKLITETKVDGNGKQGIMNFATNIANVLGKVIENVSVIGQITSTIESKENFEKAIKDSLNTTIENTEVQVQYSADKKNWTDSIENAKYFKVVLVGSKMDAGEVKELKFTLNNIRELINFNLAYTVDGKEEVVDLKADSTFEGVTPDEAKDKDVDAKGTEQKTDKLNVVMKATTGNSELKNEDEINAGQTITYTYTITNNTDQDINNVTFKATHEGANVFAIETADREVKLYTDTEKQNQNFSFVREQSDDSEYVVNNITIPAKATKTIKYQVRVKEAADKLNTTVEITGDNIEEIKINTTNAVKAASLKLELEARVSKEYAKKIGDTVGLVLKVNNTSGKQLENIPVSIQVPEEYKINEIYSADATENDDSENKNYSIINKQDNSATFEIKTLNADASKEMIVTLKVVKDVDKKDSKIRYIAKVNDETYYSNYAEIELTKREVSKITVEQTSNIKEALKNGDKLNYQIKIKNVGEVSDGITVSDEVPSAAQIKNAYFKIGEETKKITDIRDNTIYEKVVVEPGKEVDLVIETEVDDSRTGEETITNVVIITGNLLQDALKSECKHTIEANIKKDEPIPGPGDSSDPSNPNNPDNDSNLPGKVTVNNSISGMAWIDANKNGVRESSEKPLAGVRVALVNTKTKEYVKDANGGKIETTTNSNGLYTLENVEQGKYMVVFVYDKAKYRNTEYQAKSATETTNSDIITTKINVENNNTQYGVTDTLELTDKSLEHIDAGFIENENFNLKLNKYISKVTVQNSAGTVVKQYNKEQLAKIEIDAKNLAASTVLVEYTLEVTNNGELAGYANELIDYMPKDLTFNSEMNKQWYKSTDGNVHTTALAKELIEPGETKQVVLTLTKTMTENNTGVTTNKAEISKSTNELSIPDQNNSDDSSSAELIVSIRTGIEFTVGIISVIVVMTVAGIVIYTKKRKEATNHE